MLLVRGIYCSNKVSVAQVELYFSIGIIILSWYVLMEWSTWIRKGLFIMDRCATKGKSKGNTGAWTHLTPCPAFFLFSFSITTEYL